MSLSMSVGIGRQLAVDDDTRRVAFDGNFLV